MEEQTRPFEVVISREQIIDRVNAMAHDIAAEYQGDFPYVLALANGAAFFAVDLHRALFDIGVDTEFDLIHVESYGDAQESNRKPKLNDRFNTLPIAGRRVLVVDDVLDTGHTAQLVTDEAVKAGVTDVKTAFLTRKPETCREVAFQGDFIGFDVPDQWIEGAGLDSAKKGRGRGDVIGYTD